MGNPVDSSIALDSPAPGSAGMPAESPRRSVFRDVSWRWNDVLIGFAPFLLFRAATVVLGPRSALAAALHQFWMPLTLISQSWMLVIPIVIARARNTRPVRLPGPRAVLVEAIFALLVLPVPFAGLLFLPPIVAHLFGQMESPAMPWGPMAGSFSRIEWVVFIGLAITLAPVAEETLYRGMLYNALRQRFHPILAALMQAAVFGFAHPFGLANSAAIGTSSLAFPLIYEWRKTLLTPILLHAAMNAVGMVFLASSFAAEAAAPRIGVLGEATDGGCLVTEVVAGGAADKAALQVGDVITAVDGHAVADIPGIARVIRKHQVGDTVSVEFLRRGKPQRADVVLARLKK